MLLESICILVYLWWLVYWTSQKAFHLKSTNVYLRFMKIKLLVVGATPKNFLKEGEDLYIKRLNNYVPFEKIEIPDLKNAKSLSKEQIKAEEGKLLLQKLSNTDFVVLLDERGKEYRSVEFADWLQNVFNQGPKQIVFIVGGPYGFSDEVYQRAQQKLALSKMTFSHQMIRVFFVEQLYRGFSILKNEPYHHE
jgi:23S rRNA (pseudouridine1915-N3)-methyltransferase